LWLLRLRAHPEPGPRIAFLYADVSGSVGVCAGGSTLVLSRLARFRMSQMIMYKIKTAPWILRELLALFLFAIFPSTNCYTLTPNLYIPDSQLHFSEDVSGIGDNRKIDKMATLQRMPMPRPSSKLTTKERNDQKWEIHKHYIRSVYMDTDHTLKETMKIIGETQRFTARSVNISHNSTTQIC
jgi:hypothetical protein